MSILETIRRRAGIFVVILIGGALLIFVLEDALTSGRFFFGNNENVVATANGEKIEYKPLSEKIDNFINIQKFVHEQESLDKQSTDQMQKAMFEEMVSDIVMGREFRKLGITVSDSELVDIMLGRHPAPELTQYFTDQQTGHLYEGYADPRTGGINMAAVDQYVKQISSAGNSNDPNQQRALQSAQLGWEQLEHQVKLRQLQSKYFDLVKNGFFVTDAEAKQNVLDQNQYYNISYILQKYSSVPDNAVSVTDQDLQSYYNQHSYEYSQPEESRKVDYVAYVANPTDKDMADLQRMTDSLAASFKTVKPEDDSAFVVANSDDHMIDPNYHKKGTLAPSIDSVMEDAKVGDVYGPYRDAGKIKIAKLLDAAQLPDSVKASHILIAAKTDADFANAKKRIDSIKGVATKDNFTQLAAKFSDDPGSKNKGGDLGWFTQGKMVPEFNHACFFNKEGDMIVVRTMYGYHLIYVVSQSDRHKYLHVGIINKNIGPSTNTVNTVYTEASSFAGKNANEKDFEAAAEKQNKRVADLKENDENVPGMDNPKELIRWAYTAKQGDISSVFDVGKNRYVVAHLMQITPAGTIPFEQVKDIVKQKAMMHKKAEKIIADTKSAMQGAGNITALGQKLNNPATKLQRLSFGMYGIPGIGKEDMILGTMVALKPNTVSQPLEGQQGVYIIQVDSMYTNGAQDFKIVQQQQQQVQQNRAQYDLYEALKKSAGFVSHFGRFY